MSSEADIREAVPPEFRERLRSVRVADGTVTLVVDAGGLGRTAHEPLRRELQAAVGTVQGVDTVRVALMAEKPQRQVIVVGSGKGGVGKSTLTANLAVALARAGRRVGLVDADIYGPSQSVLMGEEDSRLEARDKVLIPHETRYGLCFVSMGQLVEKGRAIAWRGPMVGNALGQLMNADWGDAELLLVDLPPGTGDVQLTMMQKFRPAGAVVVSTPQDLALIDATRALDLFSQADIPVAGLVENMAGFVCPECGATSHPFGEGGAQDAARDLGVPFLGRVPLTMAIREASDAGTPPAAGDGPEAAPFAAIAARLDDWLTAGAGT
ncbi:Mrp/NBP35 family ATP-binding protein [Aurantiacibacter spongiae]|uniref:Iron-sulfur cluster carrier protein n=1 Tax=Aurantiacibacter spongiae TaxID=2488860 RepID=A0A3N5CR99_9SPHN|nr:Mrp/NBP35 family ATP-binding protein [Aurantiacibacter spongiae]RPF71137.1 chromosome partitioning protein ParA [Aurantiacibacter spongiae]